MPEETKNHSFRWSVEAMDAGVHCAEIAALHFVVQIRIGDERR